MGAGRAPTSNLRPIAQHPYSLDVCCQHVDHADNALAQVARYDDKCPPYGRDE
jgi:hypothetical protein